MSVENKVFLTVIGATALIVGAAVVFLGGGKGSPSPIVDQTILVRETSPALGSTAAPVTVVEFSDFECPACKAAQLTIKPLIKEYGDRVRFVYRHYPLPGHDYGFLAAQAAQAAGLQGKFWEMHDKLFEKSPDLSKDRLFQYALELGLNADQFTRDFDSDAVRQGILDDQTDGNKAGISATPTFFINGTKFTGSLTLSDFQREINSRLK